MKRLRNLAVAAAIALALPALAWAGQNITGTVSLGAAFLETVNSGGVLSGYQIPAAISSSIQYANGTAAGQVDTLYAKQITLAAATTTLDLTNLVDPSGATVNFARVREIVVQNPDPNATHTVKVSAGAANGWSVLPPAASALVAQPSGGTIRISDPQSTGGGVGNVTAVGSKTVLLDPGANTITINVLFAGGSAA